MAFPNSPAVGTKKVASNTKGKRKNQGAMAKAAQLPKTV